MDLPTPLKTNMEPENDGSLEGISPLQGPQFSVEPYEFSGVYCKLHSTNIAMEHLPILILMVFTRKDI